MGNAIDITKIASIDKDEFIKSFSESATTEIENLIKSVGTEEDKRVIQETSIKMTALYQQMYFVESKEDRDSIQRTLNNYKSVLKAISARNELDFANEIIKICKKAALFALGSAIKFAVF